MGSIDKQVKLEQSATRLGLSATRCISICIHACPRVKIGRDAHDTERDQIDGNPDQVL